MLHDIDLQHLHEEYRDHFFYKDFENQITLKQTKNKKTFHNT